MTVHNITLLLSETIDCKDRNYNTLLVSVLLAIRQRMVSYRVNIGEHQTFMLWRFMFQLSRLVSTVGLLPVKLPPEKRGLSCFCTDPSY